VNESDDHFFRTVWQKSATCKLDIQATGFAIDVPLDNINHFLFASDKECRLADM